MTDFRLQELKRAWEASGSVEDEAAYLRERLRIGDLTPERLELAAQCGHKGAISALSDALEPRSPAQIAYSLVPSLKEDRCMRWVWVFPLVEWAAAQEWPSVDGNPLIRRLSSASERALEALRGWLDSPERGPRAVKRVQGALDKAIAAGIREQQEAGYRAALVKPADRALMSIGAVLSRAVSIIACRHPADPRAVAASAWRDFLGEGSLDLSAAVSRHLANRVLHCVP